MVKVLNPAFYSGTDPKQLEKMKSQQEAAAFKKNREANRSAEKNPKGEDEPGLTSGMMNEESKVGGDNPSKLRNKGNTGAKGNKTNKSRSVPKNKTGGSAMDDYQFGGNSSAANKKGTAGGKKFKRNFDDNSNFEKERDPRACADAVRKINLIYFR
ncbi:MAG: hypothetical protein MJ252_16355 [archaeon]|nr:hypothetical protein [archaeon]